MRRSRKSKWRTCASKWTISTGNGTIRFLPAQIEEKRSVNFLRDLRDVKRRHTVYADNVYADEKKEERLEKERGIYCLTCQRGADWKAWNTMVARTRSRVEHVFGWITKAMGGKGQRAIGLRRNRTGIGLTNLVYNMSRYSRVYYAPT